MELEKRISELQEFIYRKRFHEKKLEEANMEYIYIKEKKNEMYLKLEDEDVNIRSIENKSIIYLWYDLFTSKGKTISKTMHEYKIFLI